MNRYIIILAVSIFIILSRSHGQIIGFDVSSKAGSVSNSDIKTYFQALALTAGGSHIRKIIQPGRKGNAGFSVLSPIAFSDSRTMERNGGLFPVFFLNYKVSDNLYLAGSMSSLNQGPNISQIMSYGVHALLSEPGPGATSLQWTRTTISGLKDFSLKSTDFMVSRSFRSLWGMNLGAGITLFRITMFSSMNPFFVSNYESSRGYITAGYDFNLLGLNLTPAVRINSQHAQVGMDCSLEF